VLQPVGNGLLVIRRGAGYSAGNLALPGGYLEAGETWTEGAARELFEETGVRVDPATLRACGVYSARDHSLVVFTLSSSIETGALPAFAPTAETLERIVATEPIELTFRSHTQMMQRFFAGKLTPLEGL
jgi:ADP-ribose pyrophosphatase YjhB (NUDIX family)